jgi:hypothetical protein
MFYKNGEKGIPSEIGKKILDECLDKRRNSRKSFTKEILIAGTKPERERLFKCPSHINCSLYRKKLEKEVIHYE